MLKSKISVERQINERLYQFITPSDAPYPEILWILDDLKKDLSERYRQLEEKQKEDQNIEKQEA